MSGTERVRCGVCPQGCSLAEGQRGICHARVNVKGKVVSESYGRITALALDPMEKKPLARFRAGSRVLSVGSYGCNLACPFCKNSSISYADSTQVRWDVIKPEELVSKACELKVRGNVGIAYTYNEPLVGYEFVRDCARLAHERGLVNVLVSNGMANRPVIEELLPLIDAANIDLKGFGERFYRMAGGPASAFETVRGTIELMARAPTCHLEVTTLIVPGENDTDEEIDRASAWLASLSPDIPYHVTRFFPRFRMTDRTPTDVDLVYHLAEVARRHLNYVFVGNC